MLTRCIRSALLKSIYFRIDPEICIQFKGVSWKVVLSFILRFILRFIDHGFWNCSYLYLTYPSAIVKLFYYMSQ